MARKFLELTFTPSVQQHQERLGSAKAYAKMLSPEAEAADRIGPAEAEFIEGRDGFYQASVSETGWPYVQFKGGPAGFVKVLDEKTIAYADFRGNRQYISLGNLTQDDRVAIIMIDYPNRRRIKILGRAKLVDIADDPDLAERLMPEGYRARPERAVMITVEAFDWNCPQHIPQRLTVEEFEDQLAPIRADMARLADENAQLKARLAEFEAVTA
ncbi:MAG: pyridoxamine 5'-phosphate oxidase family protein [Pseudomonadota bacterium]